MSTATANFTVTYGDPVISTINPNPAKITDNTISVVGENFINGVSVVKVDGVIVSPNIMGNPPRFELNIPGMGIGVGNHTVSVTNP